MAIPYKGKAPDADFAVVTKKYVDDQYAATKVDTAYVNSSTAAKATTLVTTGYVDSADSTIAKKTAVDAADALYVPNTSRGAANGVPSLDSSGYIPSGQLGTVQTARLPVFKNVDTTFLTGSRELLTINPKEFRVATLTIADPGYSYIPLMFATLQGGSLNGTQAAVGKGTGNYAQISILRASDDQKYGWMITTGQKQLDYHQVLPYGALNQTPTTVPPCNGSTVMNLWIGLYGGTTYTFTPLNLQFHCIVMPAV